MISFKKGVQLLSFLLVCSVYSQSKTTLSLYDYFDNAIGKKNLGINNGSIHLNLFRIYDQSHRYYNTDKYFSGDLVYDSQPYINESLKYDTFKDVLVAKIDEPNNTLGIELVQQKVEWFTFNNIKFINLSFERRQPEFIKGYYEVYAENEKLSLYVKHRKDQIEVLTNDGLFYKYQIADSFVLKYNNNFYKADDARDLMRLFPNYENAIRDYAYVNRDAEKSDKVQFMKIMTDFVNNILPKDAK